MSSGGFLLLSTTSTATHLRSNERRERGFLYQLDIRHRLDSCHASYGLLKQICIFPTIEPVAKFIQISLQVLYGDLME